MSAVIGDSYLAFDTETCCMSYVDTNCRITQCSPQPLVFLLARMSVAALLQSWKHLLAMRNSVTGNCMCECVCHALSNQFPDVKYLKNVVEKES